MSQVFGDDQDDDEDNEDDEEDDEGQFFVLPRFRKLLTEPPDPSLLGSDIGDTPSGSRTPNGLESAGPGLEGGASTGFSWFGRKHRPTRGVKYSAVGEDEQA